MYDDPISFTDPTGEIVPIVLAGAAAGGILGAISGAYGAYATGGNVAAGFIIGGVTGAAAGVVAPLGGTTAGWIIGSRVLAWGLGNLARQMQNIPGNPCFKFNVACRSRRDRGDPRRGGDRLSAGARGCGLTERGYVDVCIGVLDHWPRAAAPCVNARLRG